MLLRLLVMLRSITRRRKAAWSILEDVFRDVNEVSSLVTLLSDGRFEYTFLTSIILG